MSPISFAMLSGAGLVHGISKNTSNDRGQTANTIYVHTNYDMVVESLTVGAGESAVVHQACALTNEDRNGATLILTQEAPIYPVTLDSAGAQANYLSAITDSQVCTYDSEARELKTVTLGDKGEINVGTDTIYFVLDSDKPGDDREDNNDAYGVNVGDTVRIDCYEAHTDDAVSLQIDAENFAGYYYIEASTLFRDEATGEDMPAEFIIPRGKIQSNFTFTMAASGDPSESYLRRAA
jgi:hypothetical protein